jgi:3-isopropylmalate dehydrogenase
LQARFVLLTGDGIGPEVIAQARRVLDRVASKFGHTFDYEECLIGGIAIDQTGDPLPQATIDACKQSQAVLLGAVGGPKWDDPSAKTRPEVGLLRIRKELGLFANLRPIAPFAELLDSSPLKREIVEGTDILFFRELTGGIYFGPSGCEDLPDGGQRAYSTMVYETSEIERIFRLAADAARTRRKKLTMVDKANVLEASRLWRRVCAKIVQEEYSDLEYDVVLVDAMAMHLISRPTTFDVVVTSNMFGDILTDEASMLPGSLGMLPSASLGSDGPGLYEPIHGSAPDIAGKGIANPLATILASSMMLRHSCGLADEAVAIESAVQQVLAGGHRTADLVRSGQTSLGTVAIADKVLEALA